MTWIIAFVAAALAFGALDALWLGWAGNNFYRPRLGDMLADSFRMGPALVFYAAYVAAMVWFAVRPGLSAGLGSAALNGALLGAICYATYDLTTLSEKQPGDPVNIEVDVIAKYVERLTEGYR